MTYEPQEPFDPKGHVEWEEGNTINCEPIQDQGAEYDKYLTREFREEMKEEQIREY